MPNLGAEFGHLPVILVVPPPVAHHQSAGAGKVS